MENFWCCIRKHSQLRIFLVACSQNNMLILERDATCSSLRNFKVLKNQPNRNLNHETLVDDMRAPIFIEISCGQALIQVPSFLGSQWLLLTDNFHIQSYGRSLHSSFLYRENLNQFLDFGLQTTQGSFRFFKGVRLIIYFRNFMR